MKKILWFVLGVVGGLAQAEVQLHEIMASNTRAYPDITDFEDYPDWIELKNTGAAAASLEGYFLSDDAGDPFKWPVPSGASIPGQGYLLVMADGHDASPGQVFPRGYWPWKNFTVEKYHSNFNLAATGETLTLSKATGVSTFPLIRAAVPVPVAPEAVAVWKYLDNGSDQSTQWRARQFDDAAWAAGPAELGYADDPATVVSYGPSATNKHVTTYFRHAFVVANPGAFHGLTLKVLVDDGCVLYLNGAEVVRRNMPAGEVNYRTLASVPVPAADENTYTAYTLPVAALVAGENVLAAEVHQASAGSVDLSFDLELTASAHVGATQVDSITYGQQVPDVSFGRSGADPAVWQSMAEATPGAANTAAAVADVRVLGQEVAISLPGGLYATNQTVTMSSAGGEIRYTLDGSHPKSSSLLYSGPLSMAATTVLRARCFVAGQVPGPIATRTYFRGESQGALPYVSVVADPATLFGSAIGIYSNQHESVSGGYGLRDVYKGKDAPGNVEFFGAGGTGGFAAGCGIRIGGENNWVHPQKALNIAIRGKYGNDDISYDLFPGRQLPIHTGFTLRDGGDNWNRDMLRDCLYPKLAHGFLQVDTADYRPSVVFINGAYYGLHDIRQRWDETWFAQQYHLPADKIDHLLYGHITSTAVTLGVDKGSNVDWLDLMAFLNTADLSLAANWTYVESKIDMDSFMDFVVAESYGNNTSWLHNREFWKEKSPGAKWRWFLTDMDRTFSTSTLTGVLSDMLGNETVLRRLKANVGFKQRLAQRYAAHLAGTFKPARVQAVISQMDAEVSAAVPRHAARWAPDGTTVSIRNSHIQQIKDYATQRAANAPGEIAAQLGVEAAVDFTLEISQPNQGRVMVQGVPVEASSFKLFPNIPFTLRAVPAPGYVFSHWTGTSGGEAVAVVVSGAKTIAAHFMASGETVLGGTLAEDTDLELGRSPYTLSSDLIVPAGRSLTIQAGVVLRMPAQRHLRIQGALEVRGTAEQKVSFLGRNGERWGAVSFENPSGPSRLAHLVVRGATKGYDATLYGAALMGRNATLSADFLDIAECEGPFYMYGGSCVVRDSVFYNPYTGDGLHIKKGKAIVQRCRFPGNNAPDTDAIDFDGVSEGLIEDCRIYRFQGSNSDGIDVGEGCHNLVVQGNAIYYNSDKGFSVGQGSTVTLRRNLVVGCVLGVGVKDAGSVATLDQNTFVSCGTGVAVYEKNFGLGGGAALVSNTIISKASGAPVTVDGYSSLSTSYSLSDTLPLEGTGNLMGDPRFVDPVVLNFTLQASSPAVDAGDPAQPLDPDNTVVDIGGDYHYQVGDYPYAIGETVVVNEVLANSGADSDWIELHNRTGAAVNIGGWFLSDSAADLLRYRIPVGTIIPAGGFLTFYESTQFGLASVDPNKVTAFALSDLGETVYLSSAVNDQLGEYQSKEEFGPSTEGESLGAYYKPSSDSYNFVAMRRATPGAANSGPRVGPIVISEIMYHPAGNGDAEYVELLNVSGEAVTLYDALKGKAWRLSDGIDYEFPVNPPLTMGPGQRVLLVRNAVQFGSLFGPLVPAGTKVLEWITGGLSNSGENLQLDRPGAVDAVNVRQYVRQDRVHFADVAPWPTSPDGGAPSLTKISEKDYGNDAVNWMAAGASPGSVAPGARFGSWASSHGVVGGAGDSDGDGDGVSNLLEYALGTDPKVASLVEVPRQELEEGRVVLSYDVDPLVPDVDYVLESSGDLQAWSAVDAVPVASAGSRQVRVYREPEAVTRQRFYRLRVELKP